MINFSNQQNDPRHNKVLYSLPSRNKTLMKEVLFPVTFIV